MGKIDIDYAILHDAFFKFQTKPHMTHHGALIQYGCSNMYRMKL